ncbi:hypothetical protein L8N14_022565, partial [Serratia marcescens]|nr:hypothetical protein [Serratia marcescens]
MSPTLEEVASITGLPLNSRIIVPIRRKSYELQVREVLGLHDSSMYSTQFLTLSYRKMYELVATKMPDPSSTSKCKWSWKRCFLLCLLGEVFFGRKSDDIDLMMLDAVRGYEQRKSLVPLILGELMCNLNRGKHFAGSAVILFLWLREHLPADNNHPMRRYQPKPPLTPEDVEELKELVERPHFPDWHPATPYMITTKPIRTW